MRSPNSDYNEIDEQIARSSNNTVFNVEFEPALTNEDLEEAFIGQMIEAQLSAISFKTTAKQRHELRIVMRDLISNYQVTAG